MPPKKQLRVRNTVSIAEVRKKAKAGSLDHDTLIRIQSSWQQWSLSEIGEVEGLLASLDPDAAEEFAAEESAPKKRRVKTAAQKEAQTLTVETRWYVVFVVWPCGGANSQS